MLASRGFGQIDIPEEGSPGFNTFDPFYPGGTPPFLDTSGVGVNTPGTTMGGSGASGVLSVLNTVIADGASLAKIALTPTARIAGPYGVSSIPVGSVTPSGLMMGSGLSLGGISPTMLLIGAGLLIVVMMAGRR